MTVDRSPEKRFLMLLARQHGVAMSQQAAACGLSRHRLGQLVTTGYVRQGGPRLYLGVGAGRSATDRFARNAHAATLVVTGSIASHETALGLHLGKDWQRPRSGNQGRNGGRSNSPNGRVADVHVIVAAGQHRSAQLPGLGVCLHIHRSRTLDATDRCTVSGILATTPTRTLFDLAGDRAFPTPALDLTLAELLATDRARAPTLASLLGGRLARHPGAPRLNCALGLALRLEIHRTESFPERQLLLLIAADGTLPTPVPQFKVRDGSGRLICRADAALPSHRLLLEVDSRRWHSSAEARAHDAERDRSCVAVGWRVLRLSAHEIATSPRRVLERVKGLLPACQPPPASQPLQ
jgi:hypothetical protein